MGLTKGDTRSLDYSSSSFVWVAVKEPKLRFPYWVYMYIQQTIECGSPI